MQWRRVDQRAPSCRAQTSKCRLNIFTAIQRDVNFLWLLLESQSFFSLSFLLIPFHLSYTITHRCHIVSGKIQRGYLSSLAVKCSLGFWGLSFISASSSRGAPGKRGTTHWEATTGRSVWYVNHNVHLFITDLFCLESIYVRDDIQTLSVQLKENRRVSPESLCKVCHLVVNKRCYTKLSQVFLVAQIR